MSSGDGSRVLRLLLDTHAFLWWLAGDEALSGKSREAIESQADAIFFSAASAWEISTKHRLGKLSGASAIVDDITEAMESQGFVGLPVSVRHGQAAGALPGPHRDPFDRMLIAQALIEDLVLVSNERVFDAYGVRRLW
jgi:PIN domain nuclease of toxin-antitoxin system